MHGRKPGRIACFSFRDSSRESRLRLSLPRRLPLRLPLDVPLLQLRLFQTRNLKVLPLRLHEPDHGTKKMDDFNTAEDTALGLATLMVLEAVGLQVAHAETL